MPELPEVETVVRTLSPYILGQKIKKVEVFYPTSIAMPAENIFCRRMINQEITKITRRGKYILLYCQKGDCLVVHLRMTGQLLFCAPEENLDKHTIAVWHLASGQQMRFIDQRRFGRIWLLDQKKQGNAFEHFSNLSSLGPEPLEKDFTVDYLYTAAQKKKMPIKGFLLDQTQIAGLGNIYTDESLFAAKINPRRPACTLTIAEAERLWQAIRDVLTGALAKQGTTIRDYRDGLGIAGSFQGYLKAYGREGKPCTICGQPMVRIKIAGRSTCFCPYCQK